MSNTTNVLAQGIEIIGSITFQNDMHIDGKVEGEILSESGKVTIGELADIKGNIRAGEVIRRRSTSRRLSGDISRRRSS